MKITKTILYLLLIFFLALILRFLTAPNINLPPDEMVYTLFPLNIISAGRLSTIEQAPIFFYLTDLGYKLFGFGLITARLPAILFGSLTVLVIFLLAKEIFNERKIGLLAAFLFAISGYAITNNTEMDPTAYFFLLLSIFFFICFLKKENWNLYFSSLSLALAFLCKPLVAFVIPAYLLFYLFFYKQDPDKFFLQKQEGKYRLNKKIIFTFLISLLIFLVALTPVFVYNYFLYKEKGITDYYFATFAGWGKNIYQGLGGQKPWVFSQVVGMSRNIFSVFKLDLPLFLLGVAGLIYSLKKKNRWSLLLLFTFFSFWTYLTGRTGSSAHYLIFIMLFSLGGGYFLYTVYEKLQEKKFFLSFLRYLPLLVIVLLIGFSFFSLGGLLTKRTTTYNLRAYASTIPDNSLVVVDPLIYTGITAWAFNDKHYLSGTSYPSFLEQMKNLGGTKIKVPVYYVECSRNSRCGWKPEDYQRVFNFSEELRNYFKSKLALDQEIKGVDVPVFPVYKGEIEINPALFEAVDRTHMFYFYPVGWKYTEDVVDNYSLSSTFGKISEGLGFIVLYLEVLIALLSPWAILYLLGKQSD